MREGGALSVWGAVRVERCPGGALSVLGAVRVGRCPCWALCACEALVRTTLRTEVRGTVAREP